MPFYPPPATSTTFAHLLRSFALGGPADSLLTEQDILQACQRHRVSFANGPGAIWTPALTLWAFLWQCASAAKTCSAAVARALAPGAGPGALLGQHRRLLQGTRQAP